MPETVLVALVAAAPGLLTAVYAIWKSPVRELAAQLRLIQDERDELKADIYVLRQESKVMAANLMNIAAQLTELRTAQREARDDVRGLQRDMTALALRKDYPRNSVG